MHLNITLPFLSRYPVDPFVRRFIAKFSYTLIGSHYPKFKPSLPYIPRCHSVTGPVCVSIYRLSLNNIYSSSVSSNSNGNSNSNSNSYSSASSKCYERALNSCKGLNFTSG